MIDINLGGLYTIYQEGSKIYSTTWLAQVYLPVTDIYNNETWVIAIGVDLHF